MANGSGFIPDVTPPGTAPLPLGRAVPGLKSGGGGGAKPARPPGRKKRRSLQKHEGLGRFPRRPR